MTTSVASLVNSVCPHCGVGCALQLDIDAGRIVRSRPGSSPTAEGAPLCVKGKAGLAFVHHPDRLTSPWIRREWVQDARDGVWAWSGPGRATRPVLDHPDGTAWQAAYREASWDEALALVAQELRRLEQAYGPESLAALGSAKCTNEETYALVRMMRGALGSPNVDNCARLCHAGSVAALGRQLGAAAATGAYADIDSANVILLAGVNPTEAYPVLGTRILKAVRQGAKLIVVDTRRTEVADKAHLLLRPHPGTDAVLYMAMLEQVLERQLEDRAFIASRTEGFDDVATAARQVPLAEAAAITGVPEAMIAEAAELFANGPASTTIWGMGLTQQLGGAESIASLVNLVLACGMVGRRGAAIMPIRGQNNVQGACDMGALPDVFPGHQRVSDPAVRQKFAAAWGVPFERLASVSGRRSTAFRDVDSPVRGLYVLGENPALSGAGTDAITHWLRQLDFLVVQDLFATPTARCADVILPGAAFSEKAGTYVNAERRIQLAEPATAPPGEARHELSALIDLTERLGLPVSPRDAAQTMEEIARVIPAWSAVSHAVLRREGGLQFPVTAAAPHGTARLYDAAFATTSGRAHFLPVDPTPPELRISAEFPFVAMTGRTRFHWQTATTTRRCPDRLQRDPKALAALHPDDLDQLGLADAAWVRLTSPHGSITLQVQPSDRVERGQIFLPMHFEEAAVNRLVGEAVDPRSGTPAFKHLVVRIEPASAPAALMHA